MSAFDAYARCYDLLYRDKDYAGEARFVDGLLRPAGMPAATLLDVGCGTGAHAREFSKFGWRVAGVDISPAMIAIARKRTLPEEGVQYFTAEAAAFDLGCTFSAIVALFHVASYQAGSGEMERMLGNARRHLMPGGMLVFDFWHGPGVLADPPVIRIRRVADDHTRVTRIAEPTHYAAERRVDIHYTLFVEDIAGCRIERIEEMHRMRYFFLPEMKAALAAAGFQVERTLAGIEDKELEENSWYGLIVARAV